MSDLNTDPASSKELATGLGGGIEVVTKCSCQTRFFFISFQLLKLAKMGKKKWELSIVISILIKKVNPLTNFVVLNIKFLTKSV